MKSEVSKKILVTRFSSLGDVALCIPVIKNLLEENQELEIIFVSRSFVSSLFNNIERLSFKPIDLDNKHKGFLGVLKFFNEIENENIFAYADLHNVLRTKILQGLFKAKGVLTANLDKGRKQKKALVKKNNKDLVQLKLTIERYADVFRKLGFKLSEIKQEPFKIRKESKIIGIAPFAQFKSKTYPLENLKEIANYYIEKGFKIYLFGGGKEENQQLKNWQKENVNIEVVKVKFLFEEVQLMKTLAFMIAMDSANMHLASLAETAVVSFWGGTHVFSGFLGYGQSKELVVENNTISCRPCSVFGTNNCYRKDFACINGVKKEEFINKIDEHLTH